MDLTNQNQLLRYEYIIKKLYNTFDAFQALFPELLPIRQKIQLLPLIQEKHGGSHQKLLAIEEVLKINAVTSYIIRHLYHNFHQEVTAFQNGTDPEEERPYFIYLPR
jgi:hypothetical protein